MCYKSRPKSTPFVLEFLKCVAHFVCGTVSLWAFVAVHVWVHVCVRVCACAFVCMRACVRICLRACEYACVRARVCVGPCVGARECVFIYMCRSMRGHDSIDTRVPVCECESNFLGKRFT